jgi:hypothetical protein
VPRAAELAPALPDRTTMRAKGGRCRHSQAELIDRPRPRI